MRSAMKRVPLFLHFLSVVCAISLFLSILGVWSLEISTIWLFFYISFISSLLNVISILVLGGSKRFKPILLCSVGILALLIFTWLLLA